MISEVRVFKLFSSKTYDAGEVLGGWRQAECVGPLATFSRAAVSNLSYMSVARFQVFYIVKAEI